MKLASGILGMALTGAFALASANAQSVLPTAGGIDWSGPYVGVHIGGAWGNLATNDVNGLYAGGTPAQYSNDFAGVFGGAQAGYNLQYWGFVFGPEVDIGGIGISSKQLNAPGITDSVDGGFYADVTGRVGFSVGQGLLYAKGGYTYLGGSETHFDAGAAPASTSKNGLDGWTLGGGYEYRISPALSVKGEYMHSDFGINTLYDNSGGAANPIKDGLVIDTAKVGINYFFNNAVAPLK